MTTQPTDYDRFNGQRERLDGMLARATPLFVRLELPTWEQTLSALRQRLASSRFKVLVLGEFKRGKSTFINALLGDEILPAFARPCTAVINEVKWGEQRRAVLHFRNPPPQPLPPGLTPQAREHIRRAGSPVPPLEVPVERLADYVVIPDPAKEQAKSIAETPYERVELYWPLPLCRNGVEVIDSPGLNEHGLRTEVTGTYLKHVDAVLFVMSCSALASLSELDFIDRNVRQLGHEYLFLICNRFDEVRPRERGELQAFARDKLRERTAFGTKGIFFLSALDALEGRLGADADQVGRSGMPELEAALAHFLVHYRGKVKLLQPARVLKEALREALENCLPEQRRLLQVKREDLHAMAEKVRPGLRHAEQQRQELLERLERHRVALRDEVRRETGLFLREAAGRMPGWAAEMEVENTINSFKFWAVSAQVEKLSEEVTLGLHRRLEVAQSDWERDRLRPLVEQRVTTLLQDLDRPMGEFLAQLGQVRADLSGLKPTAAVEGEQVGALERILAGSGGFFLGGLGSAVEGVTMGYKGMLHGLVPQIGVGLGVVMLFGWNPVLLLAALLGTSIIRSLMHGDSVTEQSKLKMAEALADKLAGDAAESAEKTAAAVNDQLAPLAEAIAAGMDQKLQTQQEQLTAVLRTKEQGEAEVQDRLKSLEQIEAQLARVDADLTELLFTLAEPVKG